MTRILWGTRCALTAAVLLAPAIARGQSVGGGPDGWQPYRDAAAAPATPDVSLAQSTVVGETVVGEVVPGAMDPRLTQFPAESWACPPPVSAAPECQPMCEVCPPMAPQFTAVGTYVDVPVAPPTSPDFWYWRVLPEGVVWQSYWAGVHEPRLSGVAYRDVDGGSLLDGTVGGRAALLRYGTEGTGRPHGLELQAEGAAFPRLNLDENWDLDATDFRVGFPLVYGRDQWQAKFSYYHLSSHMGDEFAIREMALADRINYSRDSLTLALSYFPHPAWRLYAEADWAFYYDVCEPWAFQFGVDVAAPGPTGAWGTPFIAVNGHIREEVDFSGNVVAQAGWLWRGASSQTLRAGFHYYNGKSSQFEFFDQFEEQIGGGLWYDF